MSRERLDALRAITSDLETLHIERRRHFVPTLLLVVGVLVAVLATLGLRPDLLEQPWWRLGAQIGAWALCLIMFPAVGVGLWFPSRAGRIALAVSGTALAVLANVAIAGAGDGSLGPCPKLLGGAGVVLLGIGAVSGAFSERRMPSATYWIASGIGLSCLEMVT